MFSPNFCHNPLRVVWIEMHQNMVISPKNKVTTLCGFKSDYGIGVVFTNRHNPLWALWTFIIVVY